MRWVALLSLALFGACFWPNAGTGTGAGGGDAGAKCPELSCQNGCVSCALGGPCSSLWAACNANPACLSIDSCWGSCAGGDTTCQQGCLSASPDGASTYQAVNHCVYCDQCSAICVGQCM
jgi:hypothetical protein